MSAARSVGRSPPTTLTAARRARPARSARSLPRRVRAPAAGRPEAAPPPAPRERAVWWARAWGPGPEPARARARAQPLAARVVPASPEAAESQLAAESRPAASAGVARAQAPSPQAATAARERAAEGPALSAPPGARGERRSSSAAESRAGRVESLTRPEATRRSAEPVTVARLAPTRATSRRRCPARPRRGARSTPRLDGRGSGGGNAAMRGQENAGQPWNRRPLCHCPARHPKQARGRADVPARTAGLTGPVSAISARYLTFLGSATVRSARFQLQLARERARDTCSPASNYDGIVAGVEVVSGQVTDVGLRRVCFID